MIAASRPRPEVLFARGGVGTAPRLDRDSALQRIRAGAYVRRSTWEVLPPWERYRLRVEAVVGTWSSVILCLESAAVMQGMPIFGEPRDIHLFDPDRTTTWREGDVVVHGCRDARELVVVDDRAMTSLCDTAVDLCRVLPPAFGLAVADVVARRLGSGSLLRVADIGRSQANRRGVRRLDWVQARTDGAAESAGESVSRSVIEWLGYERPELQVRFKIEGHDDRVDFFWRDRRIIGESDGYGKYDASDADAVKAHFVREKKREDRLRRHVNGFRRWDWAQTMTWTALDANLRSGGLIPVRDRDLALLATLARNPRSLPSTRRDR